MANKKHLNILKQGVAVWNEWRANNKETQPDLFGVELVGTELSGANLSRAIFSATYLRGANLVGANLYEAQLSYAFLLNADLRRADLRGAFLIDANLSEAGLVDTDFSGATLFRACLVDTDLSGANLSEAILRKANLSGANLTGANLTGTDLNGANLNGANLNGANFARAKCGYTVFTNVNLSEIDGLDIIQHQAPSTIGIDTLYMSQGRIPKNFLHGCGVPENLIESLPLLVEGKELKTLPNSVFGIPIEDRKLQCDIFMIMPFAETFQPIYDDHIKRVAESLGHTIKRGDDFFGKTSIMTDIWSALNNAKLIIAECTGRNPNVFYEMGIAHSLDKAVIMITQNLEDIPFDIRHLRVIKYEYNPRGMTKFEATLKTAISSLLEEHF